MRDPTFKIYYQVHKHAFEPDDYKHNGKKYDCEFEARDKEEAEYVFRHGADKNYEDYEILRITKLIPTYEEVEV